MDSGGSCKSDAIIIRASAFDKSMPHENDASSGKVLDIRIPKTLSLERDSLEISSQVRSVELLSQKISRQL